jgi:hypothetical protein
MNTQIEYNTLSRTSIDTVEPLLIPEHVRHIECGEARGIRIDDESFILIQKYEGTALKSAIETGHLHKKPPFGFSLMIVNEQRHPMFINRRKDIYFCDSRDRMNKSGQIEDSILVVGPYDKAIHDTILEFSDGTNVRCEYYVIVTKGANLYDGTRHFMMTEQLTDIKQLKIRNIQKRIISTIVRMHEERKHDEEAYEKWSREEKLYEEIKKKRIINRAIVQDEFYEAFKFFPYYVVTLALAYILYLLYEI